MQGNSFVSSDAGIIESFYYFDCSSEVELNKSMIELSEISCLLVDGTGIFLNYFQFLVTLLLSHLFEAVIIVPFIYEISSG